MFVSIRLTIVILPSIALTSIIGTLIPQNQSAKAYIRQYGETAYRVLDFLDIFDMYHSWWFRLLLFLLCINILICSIDRFSKTFKRLFNKTPAFNWGSFKNGPYIETFSDDRPGHLIKKHYESTISKHFGYRRTESTDSGFRIFAEKQRLAGLGVYMVHFSVILLIIGGLIGSIFGFDGFITIPEGETRNRIDLKRTGTAYALDFDVRCDDFQVAFYDTGEPEEYKSTLSIIENNKVVLKKEIIVNRPLRYKGINLFQSSYGKIPSKELPLIFKNKENKMTYRKKAVMGKAIDLPEGGGRFVLKRYDHAYHFMGHHIGEAYIGLLTPKKGQPMTVVLPLGFPGFDKMRKGRLIISIDKHKQRYYTGLQVTKDPGVYIVYAGFIVMIIGCIVTFFLPHQRICVNVDEGPNKSVVLVSGRTNKNKVAMKHLVRKIAEKLQQ